MVGIGKCLFRGVSIVRHPVCCTSEGKRKGGGVSSKCLGRWEGEGWSAQLQRADVLVFVVFLAETDDDSSGRAGGSSEKEAGMTFSLRAYGMTRLLGIAGRETLVYVHLVRTQTLVALSH